MITYRNETVAERQQELILLYNLLALSYDEYSYSQSWLLRAPAEVDTTFMESKRTENRDALRTDRNEIVVLMTQLLQDGVEPLTPDEYLDRNVAEVLESGLLRQEAVATLGGQEAVQGFKEVAANVINEAITAAAQEAAAREAAQQAAAAHQVADQAADQAEAADQA